MSVISTFTDPSELFLVKRISDPAEVLDVQFRESFHSQLNVLAYEVRAFSLHIVSQSVEVFHYQLYLHFHRYFCKSRSILKDSMSLVTQWFQSTWTLK